MNQIKKNILWLAAFLGINTIGLCSEPFAVGPYLGQTPPGPIAKVFAPGLICHPGPQHWEANATFSADGNTFCFSRLGYVYITENTDQGWTTPELIKSIPANVWSPWSACLSADANSIYFIYIYDPSPYHPFRCQRTSDGWSDPQLLGPTFSYSGAYAGFSFSRFLLSLRTAGAFF